MDRLRWLELCILVLIFCLQIYAFIFVFPVEKELYEKCSLKMLCLYGKIDVPECDLIIEQNRNIPQEVINISIDG